MDARGQRITGAAPLRDVAAHRLRRLALGLAIVGVYGVMAYLVSQGRRETGIRLALGASPRTILGLVMRRGLAVALVGLGVGMIGAVALTRFMEGLLFGVRPHDPLTFIAIPMVLGLTTVAAVYAPLDAPQPSTR